MKKLRKSSQQNRTRKAWNSTWSHQQWQTAENVASHLTCSGIEPRFMGLKFETIKISTKAVRSMIIAVKRGNHKNNMHNNTSSTCDSF